MRVSVGVLLALALAAPGRHYHSHAAPAGAGAACGAADVVVVGGATAGIAAALASARENVSTCLVLPTDWYGGQLTANGIPAIDFSPEGYPTAFGKTLDTRLSNLPAAFVEVLATLAKPNYRTCWVSPYCFLAADLEQTLARMADAAAPHLTVLANSVVRNVSRGAGRIVGLTVITRTAVGHARTGCAQAPGYEARTSQQLADWYAEADSARFTKATQVLRPRVVVDGSYWGEALALSQGAYLQGCDEAYDGDTRGLGNDQIGQSATVTFNVRLDEAPRPWASPFPPRPEWYYTAFAPSPAIHTKSHTLSWLELWTRRRSYAAPINDTTATRHAVPAAAPAVGMNPPPSNEASNGDVSLMAWNDYYWGYLLLPKAAARAAVESNTWAAGLNLTALSLAEQFSYNAFGYFRGQAPAPYANRTSLDSTHLGTCTGLSRLPYLRDTRRSIGLDGFIMNLSQVAPQAGKHTSRRPHDTVAIALHGCDFWGHRMQPFASEYPAYMQKGYPTAPTYIPFRALTNRDTSNLLVSGLTMAQSFMVNSGLRMHPIEWASGVAAGAAAAAMVANNVGTTAEALASHLDAVLAAAARHTPQDWDLA